MLMGYHVPFSFLFLCIVFMGSLSFFLVKISYSFQITLMVLNHFFYLLLQLLVKEEKKVNQVGLGMMKNKEGVVLH
jgi:hypothetical protein